MLRYWIFPGPERTANLVEGISSKNRSDLSVTCILNFSMSFVSRRYTRYSIIRKKLLLSYTIDTHISHTHNTRTHTRANTNISTTPCVRAHAKNAYPHKHTSVRILKRVLALQQSVHFSCTVPYFKTALGQWSLLKPLNISLQKCVKRDARWFRNCRSHAILLDNIFWVFVGKDDSWNTCKEFSLYSYKFIIIFMGIVGLQVSRDSGER